MTIEIDNPAGDQNSGEDSPLATLEELAASIDKSADDAGDAEATKTEDEGSDGPANEGGSSAYEKLLAKYGGDKEKMAQAVFDNQNRIARTTRDTDEQLAEMRALLEEIKGSKESEIKIEEIVKDDPYVKEINADLASMQREASEIRQAQQELNVKYTKLSREVTRLEGQVEVADEGEQYALREKLREARSDLREIEREFNSKQRDYAGLEKQWKTSQRQLRDAESNARARVERERADALQQQRESATVQREYVDSLTAEAAKFGIEPGTKLYRHLAVAFRSEIIDHMKDLKSRGVNDAIDIPAAVKKLMGEYAESAGVKPKAVRVAVDKGKVPSPTLTEPKRETEGSRRESTKGDKQDAAWWKNRARTLAP